MIIMPSLAALAGRAGDWDRAVVSAAKLKKGTLPGLCTVPNRKNNLSAEWKHYSIQGVNIWMKTELDMTTRRCVIQLVLLVEKRIWKVILNCYLHHKCTTDYVCVNIFQSVWWFTFVKDDIFWHIGWLNLVYVTMRAYKCIYVNRWGVSA